jgi:hypothetical protein
MAVIGINPRTCGTTPARHAASPRTVPEIPALPPELEPGRPLEIPPPLPEAQPGTVPEIPPPVPEVPTPAPPEIPY